MTTMEKFEKFCVTCRNDDELYLLMEYFENKGIKWSSGKNALSYKGRFSATSPIYIYIEPDDGDHRRIMYATILYGGYPLLNVHDVIDGYSSTIYTDDISDILKLSEEF